MPGFTWPMLPVMMMPNPTPAMIREARRHAGLTQQEAIELLKGRKLGPRAYRTWQNWEAGHRKMPEEAWKLFLIKAKKLIEKGKAAATAA